MKNLQSVIKDIQGALAKINAKLNEELSEVNKATYLALKENLIRAIDNLKKIQGK